MAGTGFHSIAKLRAQSFNPVLADRGVDSADCHTKMVVLLIAKVKSLSLRADCHRSELSAWFVLGLRSGVGNPQCIGKLFAKDLLLLWQSTELERGS
jgi:hypothetical protein